jgi:tRNA pseudouridine13 synthase
VNDRSDDPTSSLAFAGGPPLGTGDIRTQPEDFVVREVLGFSADTNGDHLLLSIRKRGTNTHWVTKEIARFGGIAPRDVGFSGLKDRHALTDQSFSIPARGQSLDAWRAFEGEGFKVVSADLHRRKLRRGTHRANDFEVLIRNAQADTQQLDRRLKQIAAEGVPNYFGSQRFGRGGGNLHTARRWFDAGEAPNDRVQRGFALSAARAAIFNTALSHRVADGTWSQLLEGDVPNLDGTNSIFNMEAVDDALRERCEQLDVHPTGPLWGRGELRSRGAVQGLELEQAAKFGALATGLASQGLDQERRALRLRVQNLSWEFCDAGVWLRFRLARGAFATTVLRELLDVRAANGEEGDD